jgi:hypothetical protein
MTAQLLEISEANYHADNLGDYPPSLSRGCAQTLATECPLKAYMEHPRLGNQPRQPTDPTDKGTLIHTLLLDAGPEIEVIDAKDWRTNAAKEARDAAREAGKTPVLSAKYNEIKIAAQRIRERLDEFGEGDLVGLAEQTIVWTENYAGGVWCRVRPDLLRLEAGEIKDLKTIHRAHPNTIAKHFIDYGYAIQNACYTRAVEALNPDLAGRVTMKFLFCEIEPPYCVTPAYCAGSMRELGESRWNRAVEIWERCLRTKYWPGYVEEPVAIEAPAWAMAQEMME